MIQQWNVAYEYRWPWDISTEIAYVGTRTDGGYADLNVNFGEPGGGKQVEVYPPQPARVQAFALQEVMHLRLGGDRGRRQAPEVPDDGGPVLQGAAGDLADDAVTFAKSSPVPDPASAIDYVFA